MSNRYDAAMRLANEYLGEDNSQAIAGLRQKIDQLSKTKKNLTDKFKKDMQGIDKQIQQVKVQLSKLGDIDLDTDDKE